MDTVFINIEIPKADHDKLLSASVTVREDGKRVSMSEHVRRAIQAYLDEKK